MENPEVTSQITTLVICVEWIFGEDYSYLSHNTENPASWIAYLCIFQSLKFAFDIFGSNHEATIQLHAHLVMERQNKIRDNILLNEIYHP